MLKQVRWEDLGGGEGTEDVDVIATATDVFLHVSNYPLLPGTVLDGYTLNPAKPYVALLNAALDSDAAVAQLMQEAAQAHRPRPNVRLRCEMRYVMEALFEAERCTHFSDRPSRMGAVFLCRSRWAAAGFAVAYRQRTWYGQYACRIETGEHFDADMRYLDRAFNQVDAPITENLRNMRAAARSYWAGATPTGDALERIETVVQGQVRVLEELTARSGRTSRDDIALDDMEEGAQ